MEIYWAILIVLALLETANTSDKTQSEIAVEDLPLTKSLGYSMGKNLRSLDDARVNKEYMQQYQEILKASQETYESAQESHESRQDGRRQRHVYQFSSPVGRRRARSEALRREKLNSQGLHSHLHHTRQSSIEGQSRESNEY